MKKNLAIYFAFLSLAFSFVSCSFSDTEEEVLSPYAMLKSFGLDNIRSAYPEFTSTGKDTLVYKTVSMESFAFTIDHGAGEVYNNDSLPYCTDIRKVVVNYTSDGVASIYVDSLETYEYLSNVDSIDFTSPRKVRVYSGDAEYYKDYTVRVNVHQVNPELMVWNKYPAVDAIVPERVIEANGVMYLFGKNSEGVATVASTDVEGTPEWSIVLVDGLPADADLANIQLFRGALYAVAGGDVYTSLNGADWTIAATATGAVAIVGASDEDERIWIAGDNGILSSEDGVTFVVNETLPEGFPLYGVSLSSYPMAHNKGIIRYMLVGYTTADKAGEPVVWSRLSTESRWTMYSNEGSSYTCPSLSGLSVVRYDGFLYALGGAGTVNGNSVEAFKSFYVSKDNGIVWKISTGYYQCLPKELAGNNAPFAVAVDSGNFIWIVNSGVDGGVWKGILNRLGFEKR